MKYKVTLAIPVYNVEKHVECALLSALNQTFDSIEYLIVDDKGTDGSMDIVREIVSTHLRGADVRIIDHVVNQGTGATKNTAIREAKGEYLFFMDSDDEISIDCIQILYESMQQSSVDVVIGSYKLCDEEDKILDIKILPNRKYVGVYALGEDFFVKSDIYVQTWNKLYCVNFLRSNNITCISSHINEDILFTFQVVVYAKSCVTIDEVTYTYKLHTSSATNEQRIYKGYNTLKVAKQYMEILKYKKKFLLQHKNIVECLGIADNIVNSTIDYSWKMYLSNIDKKSKVEYIECCLDFEGIYQILYTKLRSKRNFFFLFLMRLSSNFSYRVMVLKCLMFAFAIRRSIK